MREDSLSIIVPVHNVEKYIGTCLKSLSAIQGIDVTFFLVENGSSDSSCEICKTFAKGDSRFTVLQLDESGVSNARNKALDICDSEYVTFVDADDYIDATTFTQVFKSCLLNGPDLLFTPYFSDVGGKRTLVSLNLDKPEYKGEEIFNEIVQNRLAPAIYFLGSVWRVIFKRSLIRNYRFNKQMCYQEDVAFLIYCALQAKTVLVNNSPYYIYRINEGSANKNSNVNNAKRRLDLIAEIQKMASETGKDFDFAIAQRTVSYYARLCNEIRTNSDLQTRLRETIAIHKQISPRHIALCDCRLLGRLFAIYVRLRKKGFCHLALFLILARNFFG